MSKLSVTEDGDFSDLVSAASSSVATLIAAVVEEKKSLEQRGVAMQQAEHTAAAKAEEMLSNAKSAASSVAKSAMASAEETKKRSLKEAALAKAKAKQLVTDAEKDIINMKAAVTAEAKAWEEEKAAIAMIHKFDDANPWTLLDVGGKPYKTYMSTLTNGRSEMLTAMFSGRHTVQQQSDGSVAIDRDGTHFSYILNYLRDGDDDFVAPESARECRLLAKEADFFGCPALAELARYERKEFDFVGDGHAEDILQWINKSHQEQGRPRSRKQGEVHLGEMLAILSVVTCSMGDYGGRESKEVTLEVQGASPRDGSSTTWCRMPGSTSTQRGSYKFTCAKNSFRCRSLRVSSSTRQETQARIFCAYGILLVPRYSL